MSESYKVFARKYRPRTFEDVLGQDHVVQTLRNAIEQNRLAHAYLFVGPRGTGKTSTARILSKALNCPDGPKADFDPDAPICIEIAEGRNLDVLEIDGASNNGVEQVRDLRDTVKFAPATGKFKIYYIDEVHMLSTAAFNALLKTLEEPPPHVKFIFATTEPNKILPTIISRCQRFDLRRIPDPVIEKHLLYIAREEGLTLDPLAAHAIAKGSEGGMRDAQSMLDQLVAFCGNTIAEQDVLQIFGFTSFETISALAGQILARQTPAALDVVYRQSEGGKDLIRLMGDLIGHFRNLLVAQADPAAIAKELPNDVAESVQQQAASVSTERLLKLIDHFADADGRMKWAPNKQLHFEIGVIKAIQTLQETTLSDVIRALAGATDGIDVPLPEPVKLPPAPAPPSPSPAPSPPSPPAPAPTPVTSSPKPEPKQEPRPEPPATAAGGDAASLFAGLRESMSGAKKPASEEKPEEPEPRAKEPASIAAPATEPVGDTPDGVAVWQRTIEILAEQKPLQVAWAGEGAFLEIKGNAFIVGFDKDHAMAKEQLERPAAKKAIEEILAGAAGRALSIQYEVHDTITAPKPVLPDPEPRPASPETAPSDAPPEIDDSFYDDPGIKSALKIFNAKIKGKK